jgi:low temperature requirement protein LtrA
VSARSIVSPADQPVTFVELFFDLVFVFCVTQVVGLFHDGISWIAVGRATLIFWLVWWAWTQFTWALNAADTTHPTIVAGTLLATAVAFFMAIALPDAFAGRALFFAVPYVLVRGIGLVIYGEVADATAPDMHAAVRRFATLSLLGMGAVLAGAVWTTWQWWLWGLAILLDVAAAGLSADTEAWNLHPEHFSERHGLFVIIALGETLIVSAAGASGADWTAELIGVAVAAVALTCALWWAYFARLKPGLDAALERTPGARRASVARDAYSLTHFLMLCGVIAYAAALEGAVHHPGEPFHADARGALAVGVLLFVGGAGAALYRATGRKPLVRLAAAVVTAAAVLMVSNVPPTASLAIAFAGVALVAVLESRRAAAGEVAA